MACRVFRAFGMFFKTKVTKKKPFEEELYIYFSGHDQMASVRQATIVTTHAKRKEIIFLFLCRLFVAFDSLIRPFELRYLGLCLTITHKRRQLIRPQKRHCDDTKSGACLQRKPTNFIWRPLSFLNFRHFACMCCAVPAVHPNSKWS